ncbi:50S ribosomal protein L25/general stress protein Ctc [Zhihengliuella salsuginis]|uniref:Large ribosomal subunit protein bL25 n=1 Tax=Zhihengliuella salsuginis TaxID=578222 RepID=A0ABQ3GJI9_9MICC|nr:50S ribosomal protein L25/general stress protein Ctc [Zhihengliuella salsuginis]GHD09822.1 50S ribosomal protein L25 [Zhihengliuella salsuginis]
MTDQIKLPVEVRTEFGKGYARRARANGQVPAVIYGHGTDPIHILLPAQEASLALRHSNVLLNLDVEGAPQLVLTKDVQREPIRGFLMHVDLLVVRKGEKVSVDVNVHVEGEIAAGGLLEQELFTVSIEAEATHLPEYVTLNVEGKEVGDVMHASDLILPEGTELQIEGDAVAATVHAPRAETAASADEAAESATSGTAAEAKSAE